MNTLQRGILLILKSAITGKAERLPDGFSLEEALPLVKRHQLAMLVYEGAVICGIPDDTPLMLQLLQHCCRQILCSEGQMEAVSRICNAFEEAGIDYMLLKGCEMKRLYPKKELRVMGDADILIRREQYGHIKQLVAELGYQPVTESDHEYVWQSENLYLELHKRLIPSYNSDYYAYFGDGWRLAKQQSGFRYAMTDEDTFIYLFTHFAKHYRDGGIGCRHVLDLWVYLRAYPDLDMAYMRSELKKLRLLEFFENVRRLLESWFDDGEADEKLDVMTDFVFDSGSWGKWESHILSAEVRNRKTAGSAQGGRLRSLRLLLFPEARNMAERYPVLDRFPWLLPVLWPVRWVETLLLRPNRVREKQRDIRTATPAKVDGYQHAMNFVGLDFNFEE
jgi:hypothetical protein